MSNLVFFLLPRHSQVFSPLTISFKKSIFLNYKSNKNGFGEKNSDSTDIYNIKCSFLTSVPQSHF